MKTIGLIGGMSWESTATYYAIINRVIKCELGGFHSAKCHLYSVDFHEIEACCCERSDCVGLHAERRSKPAGHHIPEDTDGLQGTAAVESIPHLYRYQ